MTLPKIALAGLGRMGSIHAHHIHELAQEGLCEFAAIADLNPDRARQFLAEIGRPNVPVFPSLEALAKSDVCNSTVVVTPTDRHREHASALISAGHRVLLEKPLTGTLAGDREFAAELDRHHPNALMLAFQRRFDEPLMFAKQLMQSGAIGRVFKIYSALEDSAPAPDGYRSGGILPDMSIHNVDEILWLTGRVPTRALSIGSRVHSHKLTTAEEDFDDAMLFMWFDSDLVAQVQVTRNHVSGYRVETIIFGENGQIHIGHFDQKLFDVTVEAYGKRGRSEPLAHRVFPQRRYNRPLPEFIDRFGAAYQAELAAFIDCCAKDQPFPSTHRDSLRAQEVISAGMSSVIGPEQAASVRAL